MPLLHIRDLNIEFRRHAAEPMKAVQQFSIDLEAG